MPNSLFPPCDKPMDFVPLGRVTIDLNPTDFNKPLNESEHFNKYLGGSPANIAVGLSRLGSRVGFIGKVSNDQFGAFVEKFFVREGIDVSCLSRAQNGESLGLTFTEILSPKESSILMYRTGAADLSLAPEDVSEDYIRSTRALIISGTALCCSPTREAALKALLLAKKHDITVIFDADYRAYTWKSDDEIAVYTSLVAQKSDIILGSREEFDRMERLIGLDGTDEQSARYFLLKGARLLVIKHGKEGSRAYTASKRYNVLPFPVSALKGFGGGDGYAAALLNGLMTGETLKDSLEMGSACAAMLIASHACSRDMPTLEKLKAFIRDEKEKYGERVEEF